jgi:hypothetical protein
VIVSVKHAAICSGPHGQAEGLGNRDRTHLQTTCSQTPDYPSNVSGNGTVETKSGRNGMMMKWRAVGGLGG